MPLQPTRARMQHRPRDLVALRTPSKPVAATADKAPTGQRDDKRRSREGLEAENIVLRTRVIDLLLQTQALRDLLREARER